MKVRYDRKSNFNMFFVDHYATVLLENFVLFIHETSDGIKLLDSTERCKINKEAFGAYYPKKQLFKKVLKDIFAPVA